MAFWSAFMARPAKPSEEARPSLTLFFLLSGAFLLTLLPHAIQFPLWLTLGILAAMVGRAFLEVYRLPLPSTTFSGIIAVIFFTLIIAQFGTLRGRESGTAFTAGLLAIKFYELRRPRDMSLIIFSCFFVVMSALLYSQVVELFVYCLIMMWVLVALLLRVQMGDTAQDRLLRLLRISGIISLQAVPLTLLLFFFFPRYHGTLGLPLDDAKVGFTDTVTPGSVAKLAQNDSEVMYVQFTSRDVPLSESMYWRGLVLWDYRDGAWTQGDTVASTWSYTNGPQPSDAITQEITIRPHNQRWLFALDMPISQAKNAAETAAWAQLHKGNVLQVNYGKLDHLARYDVVSVLAPPLQQLSEPEKWAATRLPHLANDNIDPQVQRLADQLYQSGGPDKQQDYVNAVIHYLRHDKFTYTMDPGEEGQGPEWLPYFLFKSKTGFCEHFASAFAVLMRIEHVPARVVVGYLGAEFNPYTNLYTVTQGNAHAWAEVWIPAKGETNPPNLGRWTRVDPTSLLGVGDINPTGNNAKAGDKDELTVVARPPSFLQSHLPPWAYDAVKVVQLRRDQIESNWDDVVLSYDSETQFRLAQSLGLGQTARFGLLGICLVALMISLYVLQRWVKRQPAVPPVEKLYTAFCRSMARRGMPRAIWEGPLAYTDRVADVFPESKREIRRVGLIVASARYGPVPADDAAVEKLRSMLMILSASQASLNSRERQESSLPK